MNSMSKFWDPQTAAEIIEVRRLVSRRFPAEYHLLSRCLEEADPYEVVYPGNPHEYDDVVLEALVLLSAEDDALGSLPDVRLKKVVELSLKRCFGDDPDNQPEQERLDRVVRLLRMESRR